MTHARQSGRTGARRAREGRPPSGRPVRRLSGQGRTALTLTVATLLAAGVLLAAAAVASEPPGPGARDRCAVCGMLVAPHPAWLAVVEVEEGRWLYFDGPKDMFRFLHDPERYGLEGGEDGVSWKVRVTDYYTTRMIDGRSAFFVAGSDVRGPMGAELVPLATRGQAESFRADHGGGPELAFGEVDPGAVPR